MCGTRDTFGGISFQPLGEVIEQINPVLRGWVKHFAIGHSSRCFSFIRYWVEMKIRSHLAQYQPADASVYASPATSQRPTQDSRSG